MQIDIIPLGISERPARQLAHWHDPLSKASRTYHMGLEAEIEAASELLTSIL
jgi:hypothetical protein